MPSAQHEPPLPLLLWTGEVLRKRLMVVGLKGLRLGSSSCPGAPSLDKRVRVSTLALSVNAHNHTFVRQVHKIGAEGVHGWKWGLGIRRDLLVAVAVSAVGVGVIVGYVHVEMFLRCSRLAHAAIPQLSRRLR